MPSIPLGARVRFARRIDRNDSERGHTWTVVPDSPGEGIFMGYRYKQNGRWKNDASWEDMHTNYVWHEVDRAKVALIVTNPWRNPQTVDPVGLEISTQEA